MPYTSNYEEVCKKIGREEGREIGSILTSKEYIARTLQLRFGSIPQNLSASISEIQDRTVLDSMLEQAIKANSVEEFMKGCGFE